jgi:excisionase family DNA binding protein
MRSGTEQPVLLSVSEAAMRLGVSAPTVRSWIHAGALKAVRPGGEHGKLRVPVYELERLERGG